MFVIPNKKGKKLKSLFPKWFKKSLPTLFPLHKGLKKTKIIDDRLIFLSLWLDFNISLDFKISIITYYY